MNETETNTYSLPLADIPRLELHAEAAALRVMPLEPGGTPRLVTGASWLGAEVERRDAAVVVRLKAKEGMPFSLFGHLFGKQWTWATLYLPDDVEAKITTEFGRVEAHDLHVTSLEIASQAGSIELTRVSGRMRLSAQAGRIRGEGLAGAIDAETQAGAILLDIDALSPGTHRAHSQVGAVRVNLAAGLAVRIEAHTELGKVRVRYPSSPDAQALLQLSTQMGAVEVRERGDRSFDEDRDSAREEARERHQHHRHGRHRPERWGAYFGDWQAGSTEHPSGPELRKVIDLVASGKITPDDAETLLRAMR